MVAHKYVDSAILQGFSVCMELPRLQVTIFKLLVNGDAFQAPLVVGRGSWLEHSAHEL